MKATYLWCVFMVGFGAVATLTQCSSTSKLSSQTETKAETKTEAATEPTPTAAIIAFQKELNDEYSNPVGSPLQQDAKNFKGHEFFPIDLNYRVEAKFTRIADAPIFTMPTTGPNKPKYKKYGQLSFMLDGAAYELYIYQNQGFINHPLYKDYLFLPFKDLTNGKTTYGGGRYIDLKLKDINEQKQTMILDFNQAYNPYCAYSNAYSCPIVPTENHLKVAIEAGIMLKSKE